LISAERTLPTCRRPVGLGAKRTVTGVPVIAFYSAAGRNAGRQTLWNPLVIG